MIRIDYLLFGYRKLTVEEKDVSRAATLLLKAGVNAKFVNNSFHFSERKRKEILNLLRTRVEFCESELLGFGGFLHKHRHKYGVFISLIIFCVTLGVCSNVVWDVRVEGASENNVPEILSELKSAGLGTGDIWSKINKNEVENKFLSISENAAWVNINRRGTVAYVKVIDKISYEEEKKPTGYANIVATSDAIIEEITVTKGVAAVKKGDSVKKGDILISGILPGDFCYAEGSIVGRVFEKIEVAAPLKTTKKVVSDKKLYTSALTFFDFEINIYKYGGKMPSEYDIITEEKEFSLFGKRLPIKRTKTYFTPTFTEQHSLTQQEAVLFAKEKMTKELERTLNNSTLLRIKTEGEFIDGVYYMRANITCSRQIGEAKTFNYESN